MAITPQAGYMVDPNNPNGVIKISQYQKQQAENPSPTPTGQVLGDSTQYVEGTNVPLRNDQQSNPSGYNGTPDNPTTEQSIARSGGGSSAPVRNPGESASAYAERILNSPFFLAGGNVDVDKSAFVIDPTTGKYVARSSASFNRNGLAPKQNSLTGASTIGGGNSSIGSDALMGGETEAQKRAREYLDNSFKTPESEEDIIKRKTEEAKSRIQANKDYFQSLLTDQQGVNDLRKRETNARAVLSGLSGSSEAGNMAFDTEIKNNQANEKIRAQQVMALEEIYADIQNSAIEEARNQKDDAYKTATQILDRKEKNKEKAVADLTLLAKSGVDIEKMKTNDPTTYQHLAESVGGEAQLKAISVLNRSQESIIDKRVENGKYIIAYQNPLTGKTRIESVDLGLPANYTKSVDLGDKIMFVPENFDPSVDKPLYIPKGIAPKAPSNPTVTEKKTEIVDQFTQAFSPGVTIDGKTPTIDKNGFANPIPWKEAIKEAPAMGLSRADFIKTFGYLLYAENGRISPEYGLTPVEERLVLPIISKTTGSTTREP